MKILYAGIGSDIQTPLILYPDVEVIYAIDVLVRIEKIKEVLETGLFTRYIAKDNQEVGILEKIPKSTITYEKHELIVRRSNEMRRKTQKLFGSKRLYRKRYCHRINFIYKGKPRKLITFDQNFLKEWPNEIKDLDIILSKGTSLGVSHIRKMEDYRFCAKNLTKMLQTRTKTPFIHVGSIHWSKQQASHYTKLRIPSSKQKILYTCGSCKNELMYIKCDPSDNETIEKIIYEIDKIDTECCGRCFKKRDLEVSKKAGYPFDEWIPKKLKNY